MNYLFIRKHVTRSSFTLVFVVIVLVASVIYSNIYHCPFVFDDIHSIVENRAIRDVSNFLDLKQLLKPRPVVDLTFALNYKFGKLDVFGYHLVNVLIHIINGFLVYFLALTIFKQLANAPQSPNPPIPQSLNPSIGLMSLFAALIFVAHPIQTQTVTYTIQRYASLATMFYMGSVLFYLKARIIAQSSKVKGESLKSKAQSSKLKAESSKGKKQRAGGKEQRSEVGGRRSEIGGAISFELSAYFALSIICGMLAFLSKQNTASLPAAIILVEYLFIDRTWQGWKKKILWFTPTFILFVIFVLHFSGFFSGAVQGRGLLEDVSDLMRETGLVSRWSYLCTQFNVLVIYVRLLFLPVSQNLDYVYPFKSGFFDAYTPLAFLFLTGIAVLGIWKRKTQPIITLAIFWFFITLSVESSLIPIKDALFEHRLYLPMFGFALIVSYLIFHLLSKRRLWAIVISVSIILSLGTATYLRNRIWQDGLTLWRDVLAKNPENLRGHNNVGVALLDKGRFKEAFGYFSGVLRAEPENANAHYNSGVALEKQGRLDEAIRHYSEALRIRPGYAKAHYNSGVALARRGDLDRAIRHYTKALRIRTDYVEARVNLGVVLARKGDIDQAISHLSKALQIDPENAKAHNNLGDALAGQGRLDEAIHHYAEALRIMPGHADAYYNLGSVFAGQGRIDEAIRHYSETVRIRPGHAKAHYDLGNLLASQGDLDGAIRHLSEAVCLHPDDNVPVCYNIACAYARQNKIEESIAWLKKAVDGGFNRWDLLKTDKDMENIRGSSYYQELIEGLGD